MPALRKRPCSICRHWFYPDPRAGHRQRACGKPECQSARRKKTQARWRARNPDYPAAYRLQCRSAQPDPPESLRIPVPLNQLPWDLAKDVIGAQATDFLALMGGLLVRSAKDEIRRHLSDLTAVPRLLPPALARGPCPPAPY
jgi:hypothetical protein